jgi:hypothetical protein
MSLFWIFKLSQNLQVTSMTLVSERKVATIMCDSSLIATILEIQGCVTVHYVMHGSDNDFDIEDFCSQQHAGQD